jgi:hypothetical protein
LVGAECDAMTATITTASELRFALQSLLRHAVELKHRVHDRETRQRILRGVHRAYQASACILVRDIHGELMRAWQVNHHDAMDWVLASATAARKLYAASGLLADERRDKDREPLEMFQDAEHVLSLCVGQLAVAIWGRD